MPAHQFSTDRSAALLQRSTPQDALSSAPPRIVPGRSYGFFTDTTLCIGCKACEVACKEWNELPDDGGRLLSGESFDNTGALSDTNWRHVAFIEKPSLRCADQPPFQSSWLMMSDVCKHCQHAACVEACPTGALFYTEFQTVVVQPDVCNGCGYCVPACPFGVIKVNENNGLAQKCTLCYDRLKGGLEPACAKACPTESIVFGEVEELLQQARERVTELRQAGVEEAILYGEPGGPGATGGIGRLNAFFLLTDRPEVYNLPAAPQLPSQRLAGSLLAGVAAMAGLALGAAWIFRDSSGG